MPGNLKLNEFQSLVQLIEFSCQQFADRPAFSNMGVTLYYSDLSRLSSNFAAYLQQRTGLQPGDRLGICLPNILQFPIVALGALKAGLILVNINPFYTSREMNHILKHSGIKALVFLDMVGDVVEDAIDDTEVETLIQATLGDLHTTSKRFLINSVVKYLRKKIPHYKLPQAVLLSEALDLGYELGYQPVQIRHSDTALLQYTMGTTGLPKGAVLTHKNLLANVHQIKLAISSKHAPNNGLLAEGSEVVIAPLPLYHIYAFMAHCLCMVCLGDHNVLVTNPKDTDAFLRILRKWSFTGFIGVDTLFISLLKHPDFKKQDFSHLKLTMSGGTSLSRTTYEKWLSVTGSAIVEGYGLTETSPAVCMNLERNPTPGSVGSPLVETEVKICNSEGDEVIDQEVGELWVRGPQVFENYWQDEELSAAAFNGDWFLTGDMAYKSNDSLIHIVDRKNDKILVSGFNVYPNEVENIVSGHEKVENCAAVGVPDSHSGEVVKLFVVRKDHELTEAEILAWCRANLAGYKVPKQVEFRNELPTSPVGKILRKELRQ